MNAQEGIMGAPLPFGERRAGKDRRKYVDPRYRNPSYPAFVDRREAQRRKPVYESRRRIISEHPLRKWVITIGVIVAALLAYMFFFTNIIVCDRVSGQSGRRCTITIGQRETGPKEVRLFALSLQASWGEKA